MPAIGHFEIWEKNALRRSSELDSILCLQKTYGQVSLKVEDLTIDESLVFLKSTFRCVQNACFIKLTKFFDGGLKIPLFGKQWKNTI